MVEYISKLTVGELVAQLATVLAVVMTIVEKSKKIGFKPWTRILKTIGNGLNGELVERIERLENALGGLDGRIGNVAQNLDDFKATSWRIEIIDFADETRRGTRHSKEGYDRILLTITRYKEYCDKHEQFVNGVCKGSIKLIETTYQEHLKTNDFLV